MYIILSFLSAAPLSDAKPISAVPPSPAHTTTIASLPNISYAVAIPAAVEAAAANTIFTVGK